MSRRPNILLITSDQHRGDCFGFAGRRVSTPHLDLLASQGTHFTSCITPHPICQPARASLLTGQQSRTHGATDNGIDLPTGTAEAGFAGSLAKAGYKTGFIGKAHFTSHITFTDTGSPECHQSQPNYGPDWNGPYAGFEHVELVVIGHNRKPPDAPPYGQHYERWYYGDGLGDLKNELRQKRVGVDLNVQQTWNSALPTAWHNSTWIADRAIRYLDDNKDGPFCCWVSFPDPHVPFDCPQPWAFLHNPEDVEMPLHPELDLERRPWWHAASIDMPKWPGDPFGHIKDYSRRAPTSELHMRHMTANYYGMISLLDHSVGRILTRLDELGLAKDTIVIFTSDHGEWLGDHGLLLKGPMLYESLMRVGMIARGPGIVRGGVVDEPVSILDLASTFADYADARLALKQHGRSLRPLLEGRRQTRDFAYGEWELNPTPWYGAKLGLRFVRTKQHKLTYEEYSGAGEMYDLSNDPDEMDNLFDDAGYTAVRGELLDMIRSRPDDVLAPPLEPVGWA